MSDAFFVLITWSSKNIFSMETVDLLIVNNCPSFYKINLYNELSKRIKIYVVFLGLSDQVVIDDNFKELIAFPYELLHNSSINSRNRLKSLFLLSLILYKVKYRKIVYGGYDNIEFLLSMFSTTRKKNCLQFESSIKESKITGIFLIIKKIIFKRFAIVLPSGTLQSAVFNELNYKGKMIETHGVGIFNKGNPIKREIFNNDKLKYLYVGRLISIKNVELIIREFNRNKKQLTIVGTGELFRSLKLQANENIVFLGFIPNHQLKNIYLTHDVFILPSFSEPWGLVIEEAIYFGLPVLVSENVGCQSEMVLKPETGLVFSVYNDEELGNAIKNIEKEICFYRKNCSCFDFDERDRKQIESYEKLLSL